MTDQDRRRCIVCHRAELAEHEPQTCRHCEQAALTDLARIRALHVVLTAELEAGRYGEPQAPSTSARGDGNALPGGDVLVMLSPGSRGTADRLQGDPAIDADPPAVAYELGSWEDDWRREMGIPAAGTAATVASSAAWLSANLGWAARWHPAFDEFAADLRHLVARLTAATSTGTGDQRAGVSCTACGKPLVHRTRPPAPCRHEPGQHRSGCDQGGREDDFWCPRCRTLVTGERRMLALRALREQEPASAAEVARRLGIEADRVRQWAARGALAPVGRDRLGRPVYAPADARDTLRAHGA
jgi:hypothetical protein